jgi:hypothetical protein
MNFCAGSILQLLDPNIKDMDFCTTWHLIITKSTTLSGETMICLCLAGEKKVLGSKGRKIKENVLVKVNLPEF